MKKCLQIVACISFCLFTSVSFAQDELEEDEGVTADPVKFYINKKSIPQDTTCNCIGMDDDEIVYTFPIKESYFDFDEIDIQVKGTYTQKGLVFSKSTSTITQISNELYYKKDEFAQMYTGKKDVKRMLKDATNNGVDKYGAQQGWTSRKYKEICQVRDLKGKVDTLHIKIQVYGYTIISYESKYDDYSKSVKQIPVWSKGILLAEGIMHLLQEPKEPKK